MSLLVASCVRYGGDSLLPKPLRYCMERLPGHTMDVGVNLSRMFSMKAGGDSSSLVPGSLASPGVEKKDEKLVSLVFREASNGGAVPE